MLKQKLVLFFLLIPSAGIFAQNKFLNTDFYYYFETKADFDSSFHYTIKPYDNNFFENTKLNIDSLFPENSTLCRLFNKDLINIKKKNFEAAINPVLNTMFYNDFSNQHFYEDYKAGISTRINITKHLFLHTETFLARSGFPEFYNDLITNYAIVPQYGKFLRNTQNRLLYYSTTGSINYRANDNILFSAGKGKHFLGNGYRSLFLSDNSNAYPFIKVEIDIWRIKYLWMFAKLSDISIKPGANPLELYDKAAFIHYLSYHITDRINFNFFETVISNPFDKDGRRISYDVSYFNPVIFYRPLEFYKGSSDNSLMGLGLNIRLWKSCFLYAQFILDDLLISSLKDGSAWWGNKFGIQAGVKAYNIFNIPGLFAQGEINIVRPYTFSHGEAYTDAGIPNLNYGHFKQELTHPFGANFAEGIAQIRYVRGRFACTAKLMLIKKGTDTDSLSYGGNIYKSYNLRPDNYNIHFFQGNSVNYKIFDIKLSYLINPKFGFMYHTGIFCRSESGMSENRKSFILYFGFSSALNN